jgi:hypothetical protein
MLAKSSGSLAIDGTPDIRGDPNVPRLHRRGLEIQTWLDANPGVTRWVVIDDEQSSIEGTLDSDRCVFTDPALGLTDEDAERAIRIISGCPLQSACGPEFRV